MKQILAVFGDIGSAKEMMPVLKVLESQGVKVTYLADPKGKAATDVLAKANIAYETGDPTTQVMPDLIFDLFLIGTSATANGAQIGWTKLAKEKNIPVLWMEDLYGTGSRKNSQVVSPDAMLVIDEVAAKIAKTVRPNLDVRVVGKPTFGALPDEAGAASIRSKVRERLGLTESDFLVTIGFGGDPAERALTQLPQIIEVIEAYEDPLVVAWRFHPKHPQKDQLWETAVKSKVPFVDATKENLEELNFASNVVIADWGNTDPYKALLYGIPVMTMLFPDDLQRRLDAGYPDGVPPIIFGALQWGVKSASDIRMRLRYVRSAEAQIRTYTKELRGSQFAALKDPGAATRAANVIMEYIR